MGKPVRVFSDDEVRDIVASYLGGEGRKSIARRYVTKSEKITLVLTTNGVDLRPYFHKSLSDEREAELVRRYEAGEEVASLRQEFGVSNTIVRRIVLRRGSTGRMRGQQPRIFTDEEYGQMTEMSQQGLSQAAIAVRLNSSRDVVSTAMRSRGIPPAWTGAAKGERHGSWKGGRVESGAYISIRLSPNDPLAVMTQSHGYVLEHRLVMARYLGRPLEKWESVHHVSGDTHDNGIENLQLRIGNHGKHIAYRCMTCGSNRIEPYELK